MHQESLIKHFKTIGLSDLAISWLLIVWDMIQVFDDIADNDEVTRANLDKLIINSFFNYSTHSYFTNNMTMLAPVVLNCVYKWKSSDIAERSATHNEVSFVWRAGYYDLVLAALSIDKGQEYALENCHFVMAMYGEKYQDYLAEFNHA